MTTMASQTTSLTIVYSTVYSGADQIKRQSSAPLASVRGIHRWPVNSPHKNSNARNVSIWWCHHKSDYQAQISHIHEIGMYQYDQSEQYISPDNRQSHHIHFTYSNYG